jgi:predicted DCC family thiol-disulfide oxidoreductase YuxK
MLGIEPAAAKKPAVGYHPAVDPTGGEIVLYDGVCGLCSKTVRFLLAHDQRRVLRFAPLQGETAAALRQRHPEIPSDLATVVYLTGGRVHLRSKAFLHVARHLDRPYRWLYHLRWLPAALLDPFYRLIARIRYRVWGRSDACQVPSPDARAQLLP